MIKPNDKIKRLLSKDAVWKNPILLSSHSENSGKIIEILNLNKKIKIQKYSSSIKFCILAEGKAHIYPRFHKISKWDIAAGHAILTAAGGVLKDTENNVYKYNYPSVKTKEFIASCDSKWKKLLIDNK